MNCHCKFPCSQRRSGIHASAAHAQSNRATDTHACIPYTIGSDQSNHRGGVKVAQIRRLSWIERGAGCGSSSHPIGATCTATRGSTCAAQRCSSRVTMQSPAPAQQLPRPRKRMQCEPSALSPLPKLLQHAVRHWRSSERPARRAPLYHSPQNPAFWDSSACRRCGFARM